MMPFRPTLVILFATFIGGLMLGQESEARTRDAAGATPQDDRSPDTLIDRRSRKGPAQAAREAQKRYGGGKVLSVESAGDDGYHVKLLSKGDVRIVFVPAR